MYIIIYKYCKFLKIFLCIAKHDWRLALFHCKYKHLYFY